MVVVQRGANVCFRRETRPSLANRQKAANSPGLFTPYPTIPLNPGRADGGGGDADHRACCPHKILDQPRAAATSFLADMFSHLVGIPAARDRQEPRSSA